MDPELVKSISQKTYRRFPEFDGIRPKVRKQPLPQGQGYSQTTRYLLTYQIQASGPGGISIPRWVRVVANENGKIIKTTTSK